MRKFILGLFAGVVFTSCATYTTTTQNLQNNLSKGKPQVGITTITVKDKSGNDVVLKTTMQSGIRITKNDDSRQTFYFVTATLKDSIISGSKSAMFNIPIKPIKLSEIKLIEFDGR